MKIFDAIHHGLQARDLMHNCIQLLLALGDYIDNALAFGLDRRAVGIGKSGVWSLKDWNLDIISNMICDRPKSGRTITCGERASWNG
jgi:hypothetical protein